ncbi:SMI1/KNR4 family protein [Urbifossiella limnaea]|uniref:SMI1 / KNR4 family protein n=1 Tax=Urbifossiella limnaea TaxID=2528023 RepID=A0A517XQF0_9BACT|nr:SMI1/KNR4 family protein [Urbifossiella limnaea]QDU19737.1 SMI1 / KNR4 family protein [Urbifossiella limnaea]
MVEASVTQLRELALAIPRPGCEWEDRPRFDSPTAPEIVAAFERAAGFPLPADFRAFLASTGGVVGMSVHNGYWLGSVDRLSLSDFPQSAGGESVAPVGTDGGGNAFLLSASGRVWRWDHETGSVSQVATTFAGFLERVVADWAAYVADTPGWRFLV